MKSNKHSGNDVYTGGCVSPLELIKIGLLVSYFKGRSSWICRESRGKSSQKTLLYIQRTDSSFSATLLDCHCGCEPCRMFTSLFTTDTSHLISRIHCTLYIHVVTLFPASPCPMWKISWVSWRNMGHGSHRPLFKSCSYHPLGV